MDESWDEKVSWTWDDTDLPVTVFLAMHRRLHPDSHQTDRVLRDLWRHGTRVDPSGRIHHYPGNPVKSWAEALVGAEGGAHIGTTPPPVGAPSEVGAGFGPWTIEREASLVALADAAMRHSSPWFLNTRPGHDDAGELGWDLWHNGGPGGEIARVPSGLPDVALYLEAASNELPFAIAEIRRLRGVCTEAAGMIQRALDREGSAEVGSVTVSVGRPVDLVNEDQGAIKVDTAGVMVDGATRVARVVSHLVERSVWFAVEPLPDDDYDVRVKTGHENLLLRALEETRPDGADDVAAWSGAMQDGTHPSDCQSCSEGSDPCAMHAEDWRYWWACALDAEATVAADAKRLAEAGRVVVAVWIPLEERLPPDEEFVLLSGDCGYVHRPDFVTIGRRYNEYRPAIGGKIRWLDLTDTDLSDKGWEPVLWASLTLLGPEFDVEGRS